MNLEHFTIYHKSSINEALKLIDKNTKGFVFLENKDKSIIGVCATIPDVEIEEVIESNTFTNFSSGIIKK